MSKMVVHKTASLARLVASKNINEEVVKNADKTIAGYFGAKVTQNERVETATKPDWDAMNFAGVDDVLCRTWCDIVCDANNDTNDDTNDDRGQQSAVIELSHAVVNSLCLS